MSIVSAADPPITITLTPAKLEFDLQPGETEAQVLKVVNQGKKTAQLKTSTTDFLITKTNSFVFKKPGHYSYSSSKWVSANKKRLTIKPGEFKEVQIKIAVPKGVSIGGYYSAVLFETQKIKSKGTGVSVIARTGSVLLTAVGNENKINRVGDIKTLKIKTILNDGPAEPTVLVQNRGNVHLTLKGDVTFEDSFGRK